MLVDSMHSNETKSNLRASDAEVVECSDDTISTNEMISSKTPTIGVAGCFV